MTDRTTRSAAVVRRVGTATDGTLDVAVAALGLWTAVYGVLLLGVPLVLGVVVWALAVVGLAVARSRGPWFADAVEPGPWSTVGALVLGAATAVLSSVIARPEWDDAAFVVRSTWVADHGALATGDMIFSDDGAWPATFGQSPNISSVETLLGAVAHVTGVSAGDVVYRYLVPLATFAAVWAVWRLLRVWGARRPLASLALALVVVVMGGYTHASFGNFHLARIWQGKALLVSVLVPYLYAVLFAAAARSRRDDRTLTRTTPLLLATTGAAAVGASSTAVFLVPLIAVIGLVPMLVRRRVRDVLVLGAATVLVPVVAGVVTVLSPSGSGNEAGRSTTWLWTRVLDDGWVGAVVVVAALVVLVGVLRPAWAGVVEPGSQRGLAVVVLAGLLCSLPPLYPVLTALMGGDAIAYRLAWLVPVPALIGLLASLPARRGWFPVVPLSAGALAVVLVVGQPLWAASNLAHVGRPGTWKVRDQADLAAARWIVQEQPEGRYLAANWVAMMTGVLTSELRPVGTRLDYVRSLEGVPGADVENRLLLQQIADGSTELRTTDHLEDAELALDALDVDVACVVWSDEFTGELFSTWQPGFASGPWTCWSRVP
ncbi:DUF6077 domain-containing protein [Cellulomonas sp. NPDC058312]|uniref:DUF6077 domain-containing protein n=1 Tax=Cellulomonas sp. NPDC058312 TaxID=3346441 RepID=UPI0036EA3C3B